MPISSLTDSLTRARNPFGDRLVTIQGTGRGADITRQPANLQFPTMVNGVFRDSRTQASWTDDRNEYVQHYKGSVYIAIGAIARMAAMQESKVKRRVIKGKTVKFENVSPAHPLVTLLERVNEEDTFFDLMFYTVGWLMLTGDAYIYEAMNGFGTPVELWPMPSQYIHVIPGKERLIEGFNVQASHGDNYFVPRDWMIRIKNPNFDWSGDRRYYGSPAIKAAASTIDLEYEMINRQRYGFKNFATPSLFLKSDKNLQPHQVQQLWTDIAAQHGMMEQTGKPMILHSGLELAGEVNRREKELDYTGSLDKTLEMTLATLGVPRAVVGLIGDSNRASAEAALVQFTKMTVNPLLKMLSEHFTQDLAKQFGPDIFIELGPANVDSQDYILRAVATLQKAGAVTPDEARDLILRLPPLPGKIGDRPVMVSGFGQVNPETGEAVLPGKAGDSQTGPDQTGPVTGGAALSGDNR
jgi:HK97 family phage portal protein